MARANFVFLVFILFLTFHSSSGKAETLYLSNGVRTTEKDLLGEYVFEERYGQVGLVKKIDAENGTMTVEVQQPVKAGRLNGGAGDKSFLPALKVIDIRDAHLLERMKPGGIALVKERSSEIVQPVFRFVRGGDVLYTSAGSKVTNPLKTSLTLAPIATIQMEQNKQPFKPGEVILVKPEGGGYSLGVFDSAFRPAEDRDSYSNRKGEATIAYYPLFNQDGGADIVTALNGKASQRLKLFDTSDLRTVSVADASAITPVKDGKEVEAIRKNTRGGPITEGTIIGKAKSLDSKGSVYIAAVDAQRVHVPKTVAGQTKWVPTRETFKDGQGVVLKGNVCSTGFMGLVSGKLGGT